MKPLLRSTILLLIALNLAACGGADKAPEAHADEKGHAHEDAKGHEAGDAHDESASVACCFSLSQNST